MDKTYEITTGKASRLENSTYKKIATINSWPIQITKTFVTSIKHTITTRYCVKETSVTIPR